jgi:saccharopine dehydrogenase-like NADP-dependent oxidoreductase
MQNVLVIGAGKIGATVGALLASAGYRVTLTDRSLAVLDRVERHENVRYVPLNVENSADLLALLNDQFAVINAAPFHLTLRVAEAARASRTHYLDLTEDVASTQRVKELAEGTNTAFIPQCGLAPGFVSIAAYNLAKRFEVLVGAAASKASPRSQVPHPQQHHGTTSRELRPDGTVPVLHLD